MIREFLQIYSINYKGIFTLTMKFNTLCIFLTLIALKDLKYHQINVNNVFNESFLKKTIYITSFFKVTTTFNCMLCILHRLSAQITYRLHESELGLSVRSDRVNFF